MGYVDASLSCLSDINQNVCLCVFFFQCIYLCFVFLENDGLSGKQLEVVFCDLEGVWF